MAKITVPYSTSRIPNEITGDRNLWAGHVQHNGTLYLDDIVARLAAKTGVDRSKLAYIADKVNAAVKKHLSEGGKISLDQIFSGFGLRGVFESADAKFDPAKNRVVAYLATKDPLRSILQGYTAQNTTGGLSCAVYSVMDNITKLESTIEGGDEILVQGRYIGVSVSNPDEGVWLENADGEVVARGTVVSSDSQTINCTFAAGIAPGTYALVVSARNGNRSSLAPAEARIKNVVVK